MEISPENDEVFGFGKSVTYRDPWTGERFNANAITVRRYGRTAHPNGNEPALVIESAGSGNVLLLDDAEEVAYRILYAVNKLREENPDG